MAEARPPRLTPYQSILVPLDGSPSAEAALPAAQALVRSSGARLVLALAQAADTPGGMTELSWTVPEMQTDDQAATTYLDGMARRLTAEGLTVSTQILIGSPTTALVQYAARAQADLIVMATHVRQGVDRVLYGSIAWEVVQHAGCPVMLIHTADAPLALVTSCDAWPPDQAGWTPVTGGSQGRGKAPAPAQNLSRGRWILLTRDGPASGTGQSHASGRRGCARRRHSGRSS
jgi:nucleotide-binding universal stress UspA family protein